MDDRLESTSDRRLATRAARPLVLIVEGHQDTRALYALALSGMGFDVVVARDGTEGYRRAQESHPDIIVTDLPMPNYDGWQFLQDLKASSRTRDIPVVAVSGQMKVTVPERAERVGFAAFLPKPCLPDELAARLRDVLDGSSHAPAHLDGTVRRCPHCGENTLAFTNRWPILTATPALTWTGTDPHDGRDRLGYQHAWVCRNPRCDYEERPTKPSAP